MFYQPTGYYYNLQGLLNDLKREGFQFLFEKARDWLINQNEWQKYAPSSKRVSYDKILLPNCVHQCNLLRLTNNKVHKKIFKWVLNVVDVASGFKYSMPLTSKNSSKVAKAFRKIYVDPNTSLTGPSYYNVTEAEILWAKLPDLCETIMLRFE